MNYIKSYFRHTYKRYLKVFTVRLKSNLLYYRIDISFFDFLALLFLNGLQTAEFACVYMFSINWYSFWTIRFIQTTNLLNFIPHYQYYCNIRDLFYSFTLSYNKCHHDDKCSTLLCFTRKKSFNDLPYAIVYRQMQSTIQQIVNKYANKYHNWAEIMKSKVYRK